MQLRGYKDGLAAAQIKLNSFREKDVFEGLDPSKTPRYKTIISMKFVLIKKVAANGQVQVIQGQDAMLCAQMKSSHRPWLK